MSLAFYCYLEVFLQNLSQFSVDSLCSMEVHYLENIIWNKVSEISANVLKDRLTTWAINKISTFRAKALRLELVEGDGEKNVCFYTSEYIKTTRDKI